MAFTVDIRGNASHLQKTLKSVKTNLNDLGKTGLKGVTTGLAAFGAAGAAAIGAFIVTSSRAAASLEDLAIQFEVLTGSAEKSKELLKQFREEERKSALSTQDYGEGAKLLLANNVEYEKLLPILRMVGDVSLGNSERFGRLSLAMAQISAKGKLAGQELNQLAESGFNPLQIIAQKTGRSYEDLFKMMEAREITVKHVMDALKSATSEGGRFYKAIERGSVGTTAKLNQTQAAVTQLQVAFGTGFNEGLKDALDAANNFLPKLEMRFSQAGNFIGSALTDAVTNDLSKFQLMGEIVGTAIGSAFKVTFKKTVMGTIENVMADYVDYFESSQYRANMETRAQLVQAAERQSDPVKRQKLLDAASRISMQGPQLKTQFEEGKAYQQQYMKSEFANDMAPLMDRLKTALEVQEALKKGDLTEGMRKEVREGVLEAWQKNPSAGAAKFTN